MHGLGGNAMDTWTDNTTIWLRDLLPDTEYFKESRIMTFSYDSDLINKSSTMGLKDWAQTLLQSVSDSRRSEIVKPPYLSIWHLRQTLFTNELGPFFSYATHLEAY